MWRRWFTPAAKTGAEGKAAAPFQTRLSAVLLMMAVGCATGSNPGRPSFLSNAGASAVEEINLLAIPVALNLDQAPGVDGFVIKVFASNKRRPKPFPIETGQLEVLMFDGIPRASEGPPQPRRTWQYSAAELKPFQIEASIGTGYQLAPTWDDAPPTSNKISVIVRYIVPGGTAVTSAPSIISVALR